MPSPSQLPIALLEKHHSRDYSKYQGTQKLWNKWCDYHFPSCFPFFPYVLFRLKYFAFLSTHCLGGRKRKLAKARTSSWVKYQFCLWALTCPPPSDSHHFPRSVPYIHSLARTTQLQSGRGTFPFQTVGAFCCSTTGFSSGSREAQDKTGLSKNTPSHQFWCFSVSWWDRGSVGIKIYS